MKFKESKDSKNTDYMKEITRIRTPACQRGPYPDWKGLSGSAFPKVFLVDRIINEILYYFILNSLTI